MKAYRFIAKWDVDEAPAVGDVLPESYVWDGDEPTDEGLGGTCAFSKRSVAERYAQYSHGNGWIVEVEGERLKSGDMDYEVIITDAVVTEVREW